MMLDLDAITDPRGALIALESMKNIPFDIKRVYYIYDLKNDVKRGFHAHINLRQVAVCLSGSCRFILDDGRQKTEVILDSPDKGLFIDHMVWREMYDFSDNCVILVLASHFYDASDYLRDYEVFKKMILDEINQ